MVLWGYADYQAEEAKTPAVAPGRAGEGNAAVSLSCNTRSGELPRSCRQSQAGSAVSGRYRIARRSRSRT
jgi:hypothetical protein